MDTISSFINMHFSLFTNNPIILSLQQNKNSVCTLPNLFIQAYIKTASESEIIEAAMEANIHEIKDSSLMK